MNNQRNKGTGAGGAQTNINGSAFEKKVAQLIHDLFLKNNYTLEEIETFRTNTTAIYKVYKTKEVVGLFGNQNSLFKYLDLDEAWEKIKSKDKPKGDIREIWSKTMKPDIFYFDFESQKIKIIECKYQQTAGSVDEKLQTIHYKKELWNKLFKQYGISVEMEYALGTNKFWNQIQKSGPSKGKKTYQDIFDYLDRNGVKHKIEGKDLKYKINDFIEF